MMKFWISFVATPHVCTVHGLELGFGVTADNRDHAIQMIQEKIFENSKLPRVNAVIENFDVRNVEKKHVYLNMGDPEMPGIWYPLGYDQFNSIH
ncbi:hypothetical protein [Chitinophaga filiformis]|uniref:Uncharacterized protein n=1 Tax=Chitinophaga filiformis TaxID=104663 RepID=A0ABY4HVT4_CHIFI|nr:hypothetical protein [Chitinophaga filiformis]UPK67893.1 hypothetical protein MYF79_23355 [Chitinophaga filiformis]